MTRTAGQVILQVDGLTKTSGRTLAIDDVSFTVRRGEVLGLIGPNGAGKSTLLGCLGGVLPRDAGSVIVDPSHPGPVLFYLPDGICPWPEQTVEWVLDFTGEYYRGTAAARTRVIEELDLSSLLNKRFAALSKGQRKRALLAVGLQAPHPVLMADEPFDGLDLRQTREMARLLRSYAAGGRTLVLSIHQISDAERVCDRFVLLSGGRVRGEGTLAELTRIGQEPANSRSLEEVFLALT
jgi:ABC-2 type transport system ATP-binding protein